MGLGFTPPHPPAQLLLPCSHEGHQLGWGGWKGGGHPHRFPSRQCFARWPLGSGGRGRKQLSLRRGWSKCHRGHLAPHTTPSPPPTSKQHPPGGGAAGVQSLQGGAKRMSPPHHQRDIKERRGGGGWVTPPPPFTFRCFPAVCPHRLSCPSPPLSSSPPPGIALRLPALLTASAYSPPSTPCPLPAPLWDLVVIEAALSPSPPEGWTSPPPRMLSPTFGCTRGTTDTRRWRPARAVSICILNMSHLHIKDDFLFRRRLASRRK